MNQLKEVVNAVLEQQKLQLAPSTYDARKNYLKHLVEYGDYLGIQVPCQELYDAYVARAVTPDLRFQLLHAVRLVSSEIHTLTGQHSFRINLETITVNLLWMNGSMNSGISFQKQP